MSGNIRQKRLFNLVLAGLLMATGIGMAGVGGYLILQPADIADQREGYADTLISQCAETAETQNLSAEVLGENVVVKSNRDDDPYALIARSSVVIAECEGFSLRRFCMGETCEHGFLNFSMGYKGPDQ